MRAWLLDWKKRLRLDKARVPIFYDEPYRLPFGCLEAQQGLEPRQVDFTTGYLVERGIIQAEDIHRPRPVSYAQLARVHDAAYLEALEEPETLASIFAVDPSEVPVDTVLDTVRRICGGTLEAARWALSTQRPAVNMAGGFHHAAPDHGGGFCVLNDIAVAIATLRHEGFDGPVGVLDLDAHPADGTAACLEGDAQVWVGSLSGSDWGLVPGADEVLLDRGCGDAEYLAALEALLERMPRVALAFVIAGGDVLRGDRFGLLGLSLKGARRRDAAVARALHRVPSVWVPGGGYHAEAWKVFAGSVLVLNGRGHEPIHGRFDPLGMLARHRSPLKALERPQAWEAITLEDLEGALGYTHPGSPRLLGHYTAQSLEYVLFRSGVGPSLERLGYGQPRVAVDVSAAGERLQLLGHAQGREHVLMDCVLRRQRVEGADVLCVDKLLSPLVVGGEGAREALEMLRFMAQRLGLRGVSLPPAESLPPAGAQARCG
ncbi:histone deacetylase family protein [Stigmatella aurantiaca]|uniref:Deacetylase n=1 Tax=Stigmatella aurantiaca (strain DW4/3-1) TaxID=378806 RepID=Q08QL0_STIAD|nr:histone deacetylase [Stigmatella aurantiaca]ADO75542.1 Histone deacetylase family protein [Stigmatella aurantiaca DW4/3-1]EAU62759.1 deacetylase [Stigmatella aurantiaca DW4/3-1]